MNPLLLMTLLFLVAVIGHEIGHAIPAVLQGYKVKKLYLGIPWEKTIRGVKFSTVIFKKQVGTIEFGISALLLGGAVDFYDLDDAPFWNFVPVVAAGPLFNLIVGFLPLLFYFDFNTSIQISKMIMDVVLGTLYTFVSGGLPLDQIAGPVQAMNSMATFASGYTNGTLLVWIVLNLAFFITNILPIPGVDGGHLLFAVIRAMFGKKVKVVLDKITGIVFDILMVFMIIVMTKDLW